MSEKNCGTCRWWKASGMGHLPNYGYCEAPVPDSVDEQFMTRSYEGITCPCWKEKGNEVR